MGKSKKAKIIPEDKHLLFRIAQWVDEGKWAARKTIRQLAQTEENYLTIIREIDRVKGQYIYARRRRARATLTFVEWFTILETFGWQCAYCRQPFDVMHHVIPLPEGETNSTNCVPACYRCSNRIRIKNEQAVSLR